MLQPTSLSGAPAGLNAMSAGALPNVTNPVHLDDLPALLGPYAVAAPIFVYLMDCGNLKATRSRLQEEEDLILILGPKRPVSGA